MKSIRSILSFAGLALLAAASAQTPQYAVLRRIPIPGEGGWDYLNVDPASHRLFISRGTHVQVMDTRTGRIVGDVPNTQGVHGIALAPRLGKGFTSNGRANSVTEFDLRTLHEVAQIPTTGANPDAIVYDPSSERVFTMNGRSGNSTAIDARSGSVVGTIALDGRPEFAAVDGKGHVFANIESKSEIQEIDSHSLRVLKTWSIAPGESPSGLSIDPRRELLFSVCDNRLMAVSDVQSGRVIATPAIGEGPDAAGFDPGLHLAFSSNGEGVLTIVHEGRRGTFNVVQTVQTQPSARTMALDPESHLIYLIAAQRQAGEGGGRPRMVPGSTVILVVGPK